jgi:hypothetical protein
VIVVLVCRWQARVGFQPAPTTIKSNQVVVGEGRNRTKSAALSKAMLSFQSPRQNARYKYYAANIEKIADFCVSVKIGINRLKLQNYSGITLLLLRCWQFCWQSNTQKILSLPKILPLIIAVTNALSCFTSPADGRPCLPHDHAGSVPQKARSSRAASAWHRMFGVLPPAARQRSFRFGSVSASLRLHSTFPFADPQAEVLQKSI